MTQPLTVVDAKNRTLVRDTATGAEGLLTYFPPPDHWERAPVRRRNNSGHRNRSRIQMRLPNGRHHRADPDTVVAIGPRVGDDVVLVDTVGRRLAGVLVAGDDVSVTVRRHVRNDGQREYRVPRAILDRIEVEP